jgi:putative flippase GtrA
MNISQIEKISTQGRKRRFGVAGVCNVLITNIILQILLKNNLTSVAIATLISQFVNTTFGYLTYGKIVFRTESLRSHKPIIRYLILMTAMWLLNTAGIELGANMGFQKNITAAALIPLLAVVSYLSQKLWVFPDETR